MVGNDLVGAAERELVQHLQLARRECAGGIRRRRGSTAGRIGVIGEMGAAGQAAGDRFLDLARLGRLGQEAGDLAPYVGRNGFQSGGAGHDQDARRGEMPPQYLDAFKAVQAGHLDIEQQDIDRGAGVVLHRLHDRAGFDDLPDARAVGQDQAQAGAEQGVVVDQQQAGVGHGEQAPRAAGAGQSGCRRSGHGRQTLDKNPRHLSMHQMRERD
ncbi:hypothetical protein D9M72_419060 [compost metagenome]